MRKAYINLHPKYNYATVVTARRIKIDDYVREIDWTSWNLDRKSFRVMGGNVSLHLERAEVVAQRLVNAGIEVFMRNERGEEWEKFENKNFSEEYMLSKEFEVDFPIDYKSPILKNIALYEELVKSEKDEFLRNRFRIQLGIAKGDLEKLDVREYERRKKIKDIIFNP